MQLQQIADNLPAKLSFHVHVCHANDAVLNQSHTSYVHEKGQGIEEACTPVQSKLSMLQDVGQSLIVQPVDGSRMFSPSH